MGWEAGVAQPRAEADYDVVIVGGGGHGLATAYYLAKEHGISNVAVVEKGWLGGGNTGPEHDDRALELPAAGDMPFYEKSMKLWEGLRRTSTTTRCSASAAC